MVFNLSTILLTAVSLGGAFTYVVASWTALRAVAVTAKIAASTSFVVLAFMNGAAGSAYGRAILVALLLSWLGDVLLLSRQSGFLLAGIASFLVAHIAFSVAFAIKPVSTTAFAIGLFVTGMIAILILGWLWKYLHGVFRFAVPFYLSAIMIMVTLAVSASAVSMPLTVALAAVAFAVSDISVARDRFVDRDVLNKAWGLPLYYFAQILFAASVSGVG